MKNIDIIDREIFLPGSLTLVVTGDNRAETIRFRMRTNPELEGFDFYLRYRNSNGEGEEMPLVRTDSERHTFLDWNPDVNFSAITGNTAIMIVGIKTNPANPDVPFVWNSLMADICVERAVGYDSPIDPQTPTLLITYLGTFQGLRDEAVEAKDLANQAVGYAQQAATDAESAKNEAIAAKEGLLDIYDAAVADVNGAKVEAIGAIGSNRTEALSAISGAKAGAIEAIGSNRAEALSAISGAKAGAIDDIDAKKSNAISDIEAKGSEVIAQIPDISALEESIVDITNRIDGIGLSVVDGELCITYTE